MYKLSHTANGRSWTIAAMPETMQRKVVYDNMHLTEGMTYDDGMPQIKPYNGPTDFQFVSYPERGKFGGRNQALHFFTDDYRFRSTWDRLESVTMSVSRFDCLLTPDFSLWRNPPTEYFNQQSIFKTRFIGAYWNECGFSVIPTASWGGLESFGYCFKGLPAESVVAVSGMGNRKSEHAFSMWIYGLQRLEMQKRPTKIIIYGDEVEIPGISTPVQFIKPFISKRFR